MGQEEQWEKYQPFWGHLLTLKSFERNFAKGPKLQTYCFPGGTGLASGFHELAGCNQTVENLSPGHFFCQILQRVFTHNLKNVFLFSNDVRASRKQAAYDRPACKEFAVCNA